jgi:hypothetical protein
LTQWTQLKVLAKAHGTHSPIYGPVIKIALVSLMVEGMPLMHLCDLIKLSMARSIGKATGSGDLSGFPIAKHLQTKDKTDFSVAHEVSH